MKQQVKAVIDATLASLRESGAIGFDAIATYGVEVPKNPEHGDWSCNVAMVMSKATGRRPAELADLIIANLADASHIVTSIERAGPGFLNLRLKDSVFQAIARDALKAGEAFGRQPPKSTGKKVLVEFVTANPTGPVHIGHARGRLHGGRDRAAARRRRARGDARVLHQRLR